MNVSSGLRGKGFTLIEMMVALVIGTLLVLGLVEVFAASRTAYQLSEGLARVQENGRFAMDYLQRDLRMAGHLGCVNDQSRFLPENDSGAHSALASTFLTSADLLSNNYAGTVAVPFFLRFDVQVQGYEANTTAPGDTVVLTAAPTLDTTTTGWTPNLPAALDTALPNRVKGSDIVLLRYFAPTGAQMTSFTPGAPDGTSAATILFNSAQSSRLTEGVVNPGLYGVADCMNAAVFNASTTPFTATPGPAGQITVVGGGASPVNKSGMSGNESFVAGQAMVYRAETVAYYVGRNPDGQPSLYRVRFNLAPGAAAATPLTTPEELVEGVESLQLRYAQDSRTAATQRPTGNMGSSATAAAVVPTTDLDTAWRRVGLVQVGIVARSPDPAGSRQRESTLTKLSALQVAFTPPNDGRYRSVYEESVALRNRLFGN